MQSKFDADVERLAEELMSAGEVAWKTGQREETCPHPKDSWEEMIWIDGYRGAKWDVMAQEAYEKGWDAGFNSLVLPPPYKERRLSRLMDSWLEGLFLTPFVMADELLLN